MKPHALFATVALGAIVSLTPAHAQDFSPCAVYLCMAGMPDVVGQSGGASCQAAIDYWHSPVPAGLAVYDDDGFDSGASAALRRTYMSSCQDSQYSQNENIFENIISKYGYKP